MKLTIELVKNKPKAFISFDYSPTLVARVKSLPNRKYDATTKRWEVPVTDIDIVKTEFPTIAITGLNLIKTPRKVTSISINPNHQFKTQPFDHQIEAIKYGLSRDKWILGDEMGLGKTKVSIDIATIRKEQSGIKHCLIICGVNSIKYHWKKEVEIHSFEEAVVFDGSNKKRLELLQSKPKEYFYIVNIEALRNGAILEELVKQIDDGDIEMIVIDEIHKCKNPTSAQGKAIHQLNSPIKIAATGTPLMNTPLDTYNILKWIGVEKHSFYAFKNFYCRMGGFNNYQIVGYKNLELLQRQLQDNMLRRLKSQVLNLPLKIRQTEYVEMLPKQKSLYKAVHKELVDQLDEILQSVNPLAKLIKLRQITGAPIILDQDYESAKLLRLQELVEEITENDKKVLIFSNWTAMTDEVEKLFADKNYCLITGETKDRQGQVDLFQSNPDYKICIGTIGAMGTGITLTEASYVIFLDSPWTMANKEQAEDRAYRIGTKENVTVITLVAKGTIDEKIERVIEAKDMLSNVLVDGTVADVKQMVTLLLT